MTETKQDTAVTTRNNFYEWPFSKVIAEGLGFFWSAAGVLVLVVSALAIVHGYQDLMFSLQEEPVEVRDLLGLEDLNHNDYVMLDMELDLDHVGYAEASYGYYGMTLVPVRGGEGRLIVYFPEIIGNLSRLEDADTLRGRVTQPDFTGEWDLGPIHISTDTFDEMGIAVNSETLILHTGEEPSLAIWPLFLGLAGVLLWAWFAFNLVATILCLLAPQYRARLLMPQETSAE